MKLLALCFLFCRSGEPSIDCAWTRRGTDDGTEIIQASRIVSEREM